MVELSSVVSRFEPWAVQTDDALDILRTLPDGCVQCCCTSPPYFGLRDYQVAGQIGLEPTLEEYVVRLVEVFREVRRVLREDGVCWLNLGDSYAATSRSAGASLKSTLATRPTSEKTTRLRELSSRKCQIDDGFKPKDRLGVPHRVVFALQNDGWYWRDEIVWCLSGGAWVYARTQKGDMPIMIKDLVRLNPSTVQLWNGVKWTQVLGWGQNPNPEGKLELVLRSGERIGCTGNHLWPVVGKGNVRADQLQIGDVLESCELPESTKTDPDYLTPQMAKLIGLYVAEGMTNDDVLILNLNADEECWYEWISKTVAHYGGSSTCTINGNNCVIRICGKVIRAILDTYVGGDSSASIHLKTTSWMLSNAMLKEIAIGYLMGDGHYDATNNRWRLGFTRNYALERDLRVLAARLNATLTLKPAVSTCQTGKFPSFRGEWRWGNSDHFNIKSRSEIAQIGASRARRFWDISVEDEPHLFALASGVLTHNCKPSPMPESVTDRCTKAHEMVFMLTKNAKYFYDQEAIKEKSDTGGKEGLGFYPYRAGAMGLTPSGNESKNPLEGVRGNSRNRRSVWTIAGEPFPGAHFAVFPPQLVEPMILAGTSAHGACSKCGSPYTRITNREQLKRSRPNDHVKRTGEEGTGNSCANSVAGVRVETIGWQPSCKCSDASVVSCIVLDPFTGSGTTGMVARQLRRRFIGCELNPEYASMARKRIGDACPLDDAIERAEQKSAQCELFDL